MQYDDDGPMTRMIAENDVKQKDKEKRDKEKQEQEKRRRRRQEVLATGQGITAALERKWMGEDGQ